MRRPYTPEELRTLVDQLGSPPYHPFLIDRVKAGLLFSADLIEAADRVVGEEAQILRAARMKNAPQARQSTTGRFRD